MVWEGGDSPRPSFPQGLRSPRPGRCIFQLYSIRGWPRFSGVSMAWQKPPSSPQRAGRTAASRCAASRSARETVKSGCRDSPPEPLRPRERRTGTVKGGIHNRATPLFARGRLAQASGKEWSSEFLRPRARGRGLPLHHDHARGLPPSARAGARGTGRRCRRRFSGPSPLSPRAGDWLVGVSVPHFLRAESLCPRGAGGLAR